MKSSKFLALSAITLLGFSACQKPELESELTPSATHTVTFVAGAPETKTTVDISDGKTAKFAWTDEDVDRFTVYENGIEATEVIAELGTDGKMSMMATFPGELPASPKYQALYNTEVSATQIVPKNSYAEISDVMVSNVLDGTRDKLFQFSFKREVAFAKMTLKGLTSGAYVSSVTIESDKPIAGQYDLETGTFVNTSNVITLDVLNDVVAGNATVWFTTIPVEEAKFTIKAKTTDDAETVAGTYTKTFTKTITLTRGNVKGFGVAMVKDAKVTPSYTIEFNSTVGSPTLINNTTKASTFVTSGSEYLTAQPASEITFAYYGGDASGLPLRIGKSGNAGSITLALSEAGQVPATKIILSAKQYSSGKTMSIGVNESRKQQPGNDYTDLSYDLDGTTISSITLDTDGYIYVKSITVEYGGTIKTALTTPTNLAVSADKVVSWGAVDGAASYVLTIGADEYPCPSNSYDASAIEDEYYDVAVVAVPSDTENYKNSAAATLTNAKFGSPTLDTPTLNEGAVDEASVNAIWTVDSRATAGYNCELYNGETKVGDSKTVNTGSVTFDGLNDGVTYTVKVNAIAVEGTKAYAASAVATINLTTKGTVTLSQITKAGTYTVKNVTVYAVIGTSTAVIGDGTAYFYMYKSNHGLDVGNTFTIGGDVVAYSTYGGILEFNSPTIRNKVTGSEPAYESPVEADEEYLTSYASAPVTEYIHAKGTQSGRSITVGSKKLNLSANNTATDGKDVEVYGFVYGYNSSNSYAYFYATSIAEDPTVPKLSVTPTSKTWASNETDAAVFTVTTNAEGVKDWSVSPTTLDWATVAVDEANGTITVKPNDANNAETANEATLTVTHSAGTLFETITLTQKGAGSKSYSTGFESSEGFTASTNYQSTVTVGAEGKQWKIFYGTPSSSSKITGDQSLAMRLYTSNNYGYAEMQFDVPGATKVSFKAKAATSNSAAIKLTIKESIDGGTTWTTVNDWSAKSLTTSGADYSFTVSGNPEKYRIRFEIDSSSTKPSKSSAQLTIDDVTISVD